MTDGTVRDGTFRATRGPAGSIKTSRRKTNRRRLNGFNYVRSRDSTRFDTSYAGRIRYNIIIPNNNNSNKYTVGGYRRIHILLCCIMCKEHFRTGARAEYHNVSWEGNKNGTRILYYTFEWARVQHCVYMACAPRHGMHVFSA